MSISLKVLNDWQRGGIPHFELPPSKGTKKEKDLIKVNEIENETN